MFELELKLKVAIGLRQAERNRENILDWGHYMSNYIELW